MSIFMKQKFLQPNFIQKLFGKSPYKNALIEINNLFAENEENIKDITANEILNIADKYKINIQKEFYSLRLELFQTYLHHCLSDEKLTDNEVKILHHIKNILFLSEKDVKELIENEAKKIYSKSVKEALEDRTLTAEEKKTLDKLKRNLLLSDELTDSIFAKNAKETLESVIKDATSDERLSPNEENEINQIASNLGITLNLDKKTKKQLQKFKLFWQIENADLPILESKINLQKSEKLHFIVSINWMEQRKIKTKYNYNGFTSRIKITKGLYYRLGNISLEPISKEMWKIIDSGELFLTNKRLIFMGSKGNKTIRINKILSVEPYKNGILIHKEAGKSPFLEFSSNVDILSMILVRLMNES